MNELNAILFFQTNFGLACEIADKIKQKFQQEEIVIIDFQDDEKSFMQKLQNELCDGFFSTKKLQCASLRAGVSINKLTMENYTIVNF